MFSPYIDCLMETACVIAFFGFLRCGEFTVLHSFDPDINVCSEDVTINDDHATLHLKSSKTDPFRLGINIFLFATGSSVCPVPSLKKFIEMRNCLTTDKDPIFILDNGLALTRSYFIQHLRIILSTLGFNSDLYNGHSFRIGAATTAAENKVEFKRLDDGFHNRTSDIVIRHIPQSSEPNKPYCYDGNMCIRGHNNPL